MKSYSIKRDGLSATESSANPMLALASLVKNRGLIRELIKRDIAGRYRGSIGGMLWSLIHPLFMLGVYTVVFGAFFKMRWGGANSTMGFSLVLFSGLIVFNFFAECMTSAPSLVLNQANYVKKVVFPLEIFPWVTLGSALFHAAVSLLAWTIFYVALNGAPYWTIILMPAVLLPLLPVALGLGWALSAIGVYVRDVSQFIGVLTQALLFLSPVFFSLETVPEKLKPFMLANPLTFIIGQTRQVLLYGNLPDFSGLAWYSLFALIFSWAGFALFQKLRDGFADVI